MKVIANWKMHGFKDDYLHWYKNLSKTTDENLFDDLGIAPPFTLLDAVSYTHLRAHET